MTSATRGEQSRADTATASSGVLGLRMSISAYSSLPFRRNSKYPSTSGGTSSSRNAAANRRSGSLLTDASEVVRTSSFSSVVNRYSATTMADGDNGTSVLAAIMRKATGEAGS